MTRRSWRGSTRSTAQRAVSSTRACVRLCGACCVWMCTARGRQQLMEAAQASLQPAPPRQHHLHQRHHPPRTPLTRRSLRCAWPCPCRQGDPGAHPGGAVCPDGGGGAARVPRQAAARRCAPGEPSLPQPQGSPQHECAAAVPCRHQVERQASFLLPALLMMFRFALCCAWCGRAMQGARSVHDITTLSKDLRTQLAERVRGLHWVACLCVSKA
jgi:hypothetical protein